MSPSLAPHTVVLHVGGLHYATEKAVAERVLAHRPGVVAVEANPVAQTATVGFDPAMTSVEELRGWIEDCGYHCAGQVDAPAMFRPVGRSRPRTARPRRGHTRRRRPRAGARRSRRDVDGGDGARHARRSLPGRAVLRRWHRRLVDGRHEAAGCKRRVRRWASTATCGCCCLSLPVVLWASYRSSSRALSWPSARRRST